MSYTKRIAQELNLQSRQVESAVQLLSDGNTIPFIARYRKEMTFSLDELQLRQIEQKYDYYQAVDTRRIQVISIIEKQGNLTKELHQQLLSADTLVELEDLYQPYKVKRKTRATKAIDAGLKPLADKLLRGSRGDLLSEAKRYLCDAYPTTEDVLSGVRDIVAQVIANDTEIRQRVRQKAMEWGNVSSAIIKSADDEKGVFRSYYEFSTRIKWIKPYQILALNRGESEKVIRVRINIAERDWLPIVRQKYRRSHQGPWLEQLDLAIADSGKRLLLPATERFIRSDLTEQAHEHAIEVFTNNLRGLLLQPPIPDVVVMGIDPGFRTGCKVAVVDDLGQVLETSTIYPNPPQKRSVEALDSLGQLIKKYQVKLIAIGNGTASRETELLVAEVIETVGSVQYLIVNEAGASVYSASELARDELPDLDVTLRGAVSIARRLQDPLAELVKIDPRSIGVGLYQHDIDQRKLSDALAWVVETVVNQVGVDLNTSSVALLSYVAGISQALAMKVVEHREKNGRFQNRQHLLAISGLGYKTFEQCAGFLRIRDGDLWLDSSAIHPESYDVALQILEIAGVDDNSAEMEREKMISNFTRDYSMATLTEELEVGLFTIQDVLEQITKPGRDPREDIPLPVLRSRVLKMEDLTEGLELQGTVRNVVDFGAFIDIGVKQDGLLHSSKIPSDFAPQVGDILKVIVLSVDVERGRIGLGISR